AEHVEGCSPIGGTPSVAQFAATEPPTCGCAPVARFTRNSNATLSSCSCLSPARPPALNSWSATLSATSRPPPGERDLTRYRLFPARPGSICCEPLEARSTHPRSTPAPVPLLVDDKSKPVATAAAS